MATLKMEVTPFTEKKIIEGFSLEIELLQGTREEMPDGRLKIEIEVEGEKAQMIKEFILKVMKCDEETINENSN